MRQFTVIGQKKQAFCVKIKTTNAEQAPLFRYHLNGQRSSRRITIGTQDAYRLVQGIVDLFTLILEALTSLARTGHLFAIQCNDLSFRIGLGPQMANDHAIHGHTTFQDKGFTGPA